MDIFSIITIGAATFVVGLILGFIIGRNNSSGKTAPKSKTLDRGEYTYQEREREVQPVPASGPNPIPEPAPAQSVEEIMQIRRIDPEPEVDIDTLRTQSMPEAPLQTSHDHHGIGYLSTPGANGEFDKSACIETFRPDLSIFRIQYLNDEKTVGTFAIVEADSAYELALRRRELVLDPVAEMTNTYRRGTRMIVNEVPGTLELQSGTWKVTRKMQARYE